MVRRGTFTPHRECPALRIVSGRQVQLLPDRPQRRLCCRLRFQRMTLHCQAPGSRQGMPPGRDSRPFPRAFIQVHGHIRDTCPARGDDKSLPPLSSALSYIRLVISHFLKTAEDRSSADTGVPPRRPRHLRHPAPMYLRNVRAYILFDCPWGIFADNHIKLLETWSRMRRL